MAAKSRVWGGRRLILGPRTVWSLALRALQSVLAAGPADSLGKRGKLAVVARDHSTLRWPRSLYMLNVLVFGLSPTEAMRPFSVATLKALMCPPSGIWSHVIDACLVSTKMVEQAPIKTPGKSRLQNSACAEAAIRLLISIILCSISRPWGEVGLEQAWIPLAGELQGAGVSACTPVHTHTQGRGSPMEGRPQRCYCAVADFSWAGGTGRSPQRQEEGGTGGVRGFLPLRLPGL